MKNNINSLWATLLLLLSLNCKASQTVQKNKITEDTLQEKNDGSPLPQTTKIPTDKTIKKGVLKNGMTYYLHPTDVKKDLVSFYIIQNVGSVLEKEEQRGLAHFLEHMAFNGTETFPGKKIINKLEQNGLQFGRDINAYTSFDETVYNVNNIPNTEPMLDFGLQILKDWSNSLLLTDEEIDAERGVVKEEWRSSQSGRRRIFNQVADTEFGFSKYGNRSPIGLMKVVDNFEYDVLRKFYHDWYRTDLQAIAIIGDFDLEVMESKVKERFSTIPAVENPPKRVETKIRDNTKLAYELATDKEVTTSSISFSIRHDKAFNGDTEEDVQRELYNDIIISMLNQRFNALAQDTEAPLLYFQASYRDFVRLHDRFALFIGPKPNKQEEAFVLAMNELQRALKFGFTQSEIERGIVEQMTYFEEEIARLDDRSHGQIVFVIQNDYLNRRPLLDVKKEYKVAKRIFEATTKENILAHFRKMYTAKNRTVLVTGVEGKKNLLEEKALQIIADAEKNNQLKPYSEEDAIPDLMAGITLENGKIDTIAKNEALNFTTFTLNNGIKVHYKFSDSDKNNVLLQAVSDGGNSLLPLDLLPSADFMSTVAQKSGIHQFSATELKKKLIGKTVSVSLSIEETKEKIMGFASIKDTETLLQLVHLNFRKPRFTTTGFELALADAHEYIESNRENIRGKMQDSITVALYGKNHPVKRLFKDDFLKDVSLDHIKAIHEDRFGNPADFQFFIVGDIESDTLVPMLEKYLGGLPTNTKRENWKDNSVSWVNETIVKEIRLPMQNPLGSVRIKIQKELPFSLENEINIQALSKILDMRYIETLREEEGGTYGASTYAYLAKRPKSEAHLVVDFDCNPLMVDKLVKIVQDELEKIKRGEVSEDTVAKVKQALIKQRKDSKNSSFYDMDLVQNFILEGYNMELPKNFDAIVNGISKKSIQKMASDILVGPKYQKIIFRPQKI